MKANEMLEESRPAPYEARIDTEAHAIDGIFKGFAML